MRKVAMLVGVFLFVVLGLSFISAASVTYCKKNSDCIVDVCGSNSCVNYDFVYLNGTGCVFPPWMLADKCRCVDNQCVGYQKSLKKCGDGKCSGKWEQKNCLEDCPDGILWEKLVRILKLKKFYL